MGFTVEDYDDYVDAQRKAEKQQRDRRSESRRSGAILVCSMLAVLAIVAVPLVSKLLQPYDTMSWQPLEGSSGSVHFERTSLDPAPAPRMHPVTAVQTVTVNQQELQLGAELYGSVPAGLTCTIHPNGMLVELPAGAGQNQAYYIADQSRKLYVGECEHKYVFDLPAQ